ncbi:MAG: glutathione S-transferase family protein [Alphaproteobacteria bacterium]|nr:glutathione S-transferase family protein [Alphaproteobacteria bacterium]
MAKLKIYGIARSRAFRTLWAAQEAGVAYEHIQTSFNEDSKRPEFLRINPMGQVPAIEDDGFALSESMALNLYIAKKYGKGLYPSDLKDEAKTWQWSFFAATSLERSMGLFVANRYTLAPEKRNEAVAQENLEAVKRPLSVLDAQLGKAPYLLGQAFTVADLNVATVLYGAWFNKHDFSAIPKVAAWLDRCLTRPAAQGARRLREAA